MKKSPFRLLAGLAFFTASLLVVAPIPGAETLDAMQRAASDWAKVRAETVRLEGEWKSQREMLQSALVASQERRHALEQNRGVLEATLAAEAEKNLELTKKGAASREAMDAITQRVGKIFEKLVATRPWLPPRLSLGLELPYRSAADASLGAAERMQHVMTILSRCAQFDKAVTFGEEILVLDGDATPRLLEVIYWGLSHGYALDRVSQKAYFGHPGKTGWGWEARPEMVQPVARLIAIHQEKENPAFIEVPAQLSDPFAVATPGATSR